MYKNIVNSSRTKASLEESQRRKLVAGDIHTELKHEKGAIQPIRKI